MGDPKKLKKKYSTPVHPWNKSNIDAEKKIMAEYNLRIKKEIFIAASFLKKYKNIAKKLIATKTAQGEKEQEQVLTKLQQLGLLSAGANLDQILGLEIKDVLERRLQSVVFRNGLARSMNQARQFIVHRHITVGNKEISAPSYLVSLKEESSIGFKGKSSLADAEHPERVVLKKEEIKIKENPEAAKEVIEEPVVKETTKPAKEEKKAEETKPEVKKE